MTDPQKVIGFFRLNESWDASLMFVMGGALTVFIPGYHFWVKPKQPVVTAKPITNKLIVGSLLFGAGWGLSGICPGPAVIGVASLQPQILIFVGAMLLGFKLVSFVQSRSLKVAWQQ
nr:DUF6691 family protein [Paraferrimonas sp. SM1919]